MTVTASASTHVDADPQSVLEFVLDLDRYRQADRKILRVGHIEGPDDAGQGSVRMWGRVRGLPPAPDRQDFTLDRWEKLTFIGAPRQPARLVFDFVGTFDCVPDDDGTTITHAYEFTFKGPFRRVERTLGDWLQHEIEDEVATIADIVGGSDRPT
jgi:hypothetical protein